jgi:hypothetical protein
MRLIKRCFALVLTLGVLFQAQANGDVIYNSFDGLNQVTNSFTTTGSTPRNFMGDEMSTIALANPATQDWLVNTLGVRIFVNGSGVAGQNLTYNNVTMRVRVYNDWNNGNAGSVFTNLASDVTWGLGNVTNTSATGGALVFTYNLPYLTSNLQFLLDDGQDMGITVELLENGVANQGLALALRSLAGDPGLPSIGTSPNGWYRDANSSGILESSDRRALNGTNSNAHFRIEATAVPEPGSFGLLMVAVTGLAASRRRKS